MRTIILAGGFGTRIGEETANRPKPMIEVGGKPMLWHVMNIYSAFGFNEFLIACGYRADVIKSYFHDFHISATDWLINFRDGTRSPMNSETPDWEVAIIDTGLNTMTGGRIRRLSPWTNNETFMVTYGDGVGDVNLQELVDFHRSHGKLATVTAVRPPVRFGGLQLDGNQVVSFREKAQVDAGWINGGFFVFEPGVIEYLTGDDTVLEREPLERLAADLQLMAYQHHGFWQPMDTLREKQLLETLWESGDAPWARHQRLAQLQERGAAA